MSLFDKKMCKSERASMEMAEDSRQDIWKCPSFASCLFKGQVPWDIIWPFIEQPAEDKEEGDKLLAKLKVFLKENLDPDSVDETREIPKNVMKGLAEMGIFAAKIPKEYGGLGLSQVNYDRILHLLGSYCGSTAALISAHQSIGVPQPLIDFGTEEQKKKYFPRFVKGEISAFALTEEGAGSDPRLMETTATPTEDGKHFLINGEKLWCTNGNIADILVVMAMTPPKVVHGKEKRQITAFIVETNTRGFEVVKRCKFMGLNAIQNGIIRLKDVKVPRENIILGEGQGLKLAFVTLNTGRLSLPAAVTGASKWALSVARKWCKERKQWGHFIGEHEAISSKLSDMASTIFAMDAVSWLVAGMVDRKGVDIRLEAAIAKLFCTEESWKIIYEAMQIRGGPGYETAPSLKGRGKQGYALERAMRDGRVNTILEGSSEIMHLFIAREALDFHLQSMKVIFDPKVSIAGKLKAAILMGLNYALWYPRLWFPYISFGKGAPRPLRKHIRFIGRASKRLARRIFHKMAIYQKKLVSKQNILFRFVDIGVDLFAMSAACSYADSLYKKKGDSKNSVELADLFCRTAKKRIRNSFKSVCCNNDKISRSIAKDILEDKYIWIEDDIIE